jgi:hypothetical protein
MAIYTLVSPGLVLRPHECNDYRRKSEWDQEGELNVNCHISAAFNHIPSRIPIACLTSARSQERRSSLYSPVGKHSLRDLCRDKVVDDEWRRDETSYQTPEYVSAGSD